MENQLAGGFFCSSKEIVQASPSGHKSGVEVLLVQNALGTSERDVFSISLYPVAQMVLFLFTRHGCWFNHEITGIVA